MGDVSIREELEEERRRRRRAGDPRITPEGRELLRRLTDGDLRDEFQAALDAVSESDPLLSGSHDPDLD
jgi:hypothetical protein